MKPILRLPVLLLAAAVLGGCASARAAGGPASVRLRALETADPLWAQLSLYDRQIAQLRSALPNPTLLSGAARRIAVDRRRLAGDAAGVAATSAPSAGAVAAEIRQGYSRQSNAATAAAQNGLAEYRSALAAQVDAQIAGYAKAVGARERLAVNERAQALYEAESRTALHLAETNAAKRRRIDLQLSLLALSGPERAALRGELGAIQGAENRRLSAERARDARMLAAFTRKEHALTAATIAVERKHLDADESALLALRSHISAAPASSLALPTVPKGGVGTTVDPAAIRASLSQQFAAIAAANARIPAQARARIAALAGERDAVRRAIVADVMRVAQSVARAKGYGSVTAFGNGQTSAPDITAAVVKALRYRFGT